MVRSNWLVMDPSSALAVPGEAAELQVIHDLVTRVASPLVPVTPSAARMATLSFSVFKPQEQPTACPDWASAFEVVSRPLPRTLKSDLQKGLALHLGTFGDRAGVLLESMLGEHRIDQSCWLIDTDNSVHFYTAYAR